MQFLAVIGDVQLMLNGLMAYLCKFIYPLMSLLYDLFINISKVNILSSDTVQPIYQRVTMILTIIMVFYVTFEFVKFIVQPDGITDKEKGVGNILYKMIAVVVLIAFVPTIFTGAFKLQNAIIDNGVIGKVILGKGGNIQDNFGGQFAANMLSMFYGVNEKYANEDCDGIPCGALVGMNLKSLQEGDNFFGRLKYIQMGLEEYTEEKESFNGVEKKVKVYHIEFHGLFAVGVGLFVAYILLLYCIDVGVRWAQLVYLQIIAPIPIIGFLSPKKDGIFQKWCKQCITTYLDLFIRIALIYIVILICSILMDPIESGSLMTDGVSGTMELFINIALIMGLLLFAQKAPKMLQELFPSTGAASGNFGLKKGERVAPLAARAIGAGASGLTSLARKGITKARNSHRRNKEIEERRRKEGKDTSRAAVKQERRQANLDARSARAKQRQAKREYDKQQKGTKAERKSLLNAEKELAKAKRSGDSNREKIAEQKKAAAEKAYENKKAELAATRKGQTGAVDDIRKHSTREAAVTAARTQLKNAQNTVDNYEQDRKSKEANVQSAQQRLKDAQKSNDPNAIAQAQRDLTAAIQARDGMDVYQQDQIIASQDEIIRDKQNQIDINNQNVAAAEQRHNNAKGNVVAAQNKLNEITTQGEQEIAAAQAALSAAQSSGNPEQIRIAQQAVNQATVDKNRAVAKAEQELRTAESVALNTDRDLTIAKASRDSNNAILESEKANAAQTRITASQAREQAISRRDQSYEAAKKERDDKQANLTQAESAFAPSSQAVAQYSNIRKEEYEKAKVEREAKESARATAHNQSYSSAIAAGISGAVTGAVTGVKVGFEAQKLEEVKKKVKEAEQKVKEQVAHEEKWLDSGGTSTFERIISKKQQEYGFSTAAQRTEQEIKTIEAEVKALERVNEGEKAIIQSADKVKDNNMKKMKEGKLNTRIANGVSWTMKDGKTEFEVKPGETVSSAYGRVQTEVDVAEQKLKNAVSNGGDVEKAQEELVAKRQMAEQVGSKLHEESFGQILSAIAEHQKDPSKSDPRGNPNFDPGSVQAAYETLWNIENSRNDPEIVRSMSQLLEPKYYDAYIGKTPIDSFKIYDEIEKALKKSTGKRTEVIVNKKAQQQNLSTSDAYAAQKANDAAASGGK